jgi:hypothetical protein
MLARRSAGLKEVQQQADACFGRGVDVADVRGAAALVTSYGVAVRGRL